MSDNMKKETRKENNAIALANATAKHTFHRTFMLSKQPHYFYGCSNHFYLYLMEKNRLFFFNPKI